LLVRNFLTGDSDAAEPLGNSATVGGIVISAALPPTPEPTSIGDWVIGASRIFQYCSDIGRPLPTDYHSYVQSIVELSKFYTMDAVNAYDTAFRRRVHLGSLAWTSFPQHLYAQCFSFDAAARLQDQGTMMASTTATTSTLGLSGGRSVLNKLNYTAYRGVPLCGLHQVGKCTVRRCNRSHDICGLCGEPGHVYAGCPDNPSASQTSSGPDSSGDGD
jgi:hypothetical protein